MVLKLLTNSPTHTELPFTRDGPLIKLASSGSPLAQSCTAFCHAHHLDQVGECVGVWCSTISSKRCQLYKKKLNSIPIARVMTYRLHVNVWAAIKLTPICLLVTVRTITCIFSASLCLLCLWLNVIFKRDMFQPRDLSNRQPQWSEETHQVFKRTLWKKEDEDWFNNLPKKHEKLNYILTSGKQLICTRGHVPILLQLGLRYLYSFILSYEMSVNHIEIRYALPFCYVRCLDCLL